MNTLNFHKLKKSNYFIYIFLFLLSFLFLFFFAKGTSPFYQNVFFGQDGAIFIVLGQCLVDGKIPYLEFFDHKGPMLIFIEGAGQLFARGKTGAFILEIINMFVSLLLIYNITKIFTSKFIEIVSILVVFLFFFRFTMGEGNLCEEYSLPFLLGAVYITFQYYFNNKPLTGWKSILLGVCFSIPFWIRANNAGFTCACIAFILFLHISKKQFKDTGKFILLVSLSVINISALIISYFSYYNALEEMINATFLFNMKYATKPIVYMRIFKLFCFFSSIVLIIFLTGTYFLYRKQKDKNIFILCLSLIIFGFLPLCTGRFFSHYLTPAIILLITGIMFLYKSGILKKYSKLFAYSITFISFCGLICSLLFYKRHENHYSFAKISHAIMNHIPIHERTQVYCYEVSSKFYLISDLNPFDKYFIWQDKHGTMDSNIWNETNQMIKEKRPLWIIMEFNSLDVIKNTEFKSILENDYYLYDKQTIENETLQLYRIKE